MAKDRKKSRRPVPSRGRQPPAQPHGDLTALNTSRLILDSVGRDVLADIARDYLELLGASSAVYEKNGDYAYETFASGWCRFLDAASRRLCGTTDDREALCGGRWLCHESRWTQASKVAISTGQPVDVECAGGIRLYAVPIRAGGEIVGSINLGYGSPPKEPKRLRELAATFKVPVAVLRRHAKAYKVRPSFIVEQAKHRLLASARLIGQIVERKRAEDALRESSEFNQQIIRSARDGIIVYGLDMRYQVWNPFMEQMTGVPAEEVLGRHPLEVFPFLGEVGVVPQIEKALAGETPGAIDVAYQVPKTGRSGWASDMTAPLRNARGEIIGALTTVREITDRKRAEEEREVEVALLNACNSAVSLRDILRNVTCLLQDWSGCEAVGIRLSDGDDFPYCETRGFPPAFVEAEKWLCQRDAEGRLVPDRFGNPVLECLCGNILAGRFDPALPFFTAHGSFWTNSTSHLLATTPEGSLPTLARNRCNTEGYESVALVPLRTGPTAFGLLQFNDNRKDRFTAERIGFLERLADTLAPVIAHRAAGERLDQSEAEVRAIYDSSPAMMCVLDADHRVINVNRTMAEFIGVAESELRGQRAGAMLGCINALDDPGGCGFGPNCGSCPMRLAMIDTLETGATHRAVEHRTVVLRGRDRHECVLQGATALIRTHGQTRLLLSLEDITERKQAEEDLRRSHLELESRVAQRTAMLNETVRKLRDEITDRKRADDALRESRAMLQQILDTVPQSIFWKDRSSVYLGCNRVFSRAVGLANPADIVGKTDFDLPWPRAEAEAYRADDAQVIAIRTPKRRIVEPLQQADGTRLWVDTTKLPLMDSQGEVQGVLGVYEDITERKRAEQALRLDSEIMANMADGVNLVRASDGVIVLANPQFEKMFGYDSGELLGKHISIVNAPGEKGPQATVDEIVQALKQNGVWHGEVHNIKKDGTPFWCQAHVSTFEHAGYGTVWVSTHQDITERQAAEEKLQGMQAQLAHVARLSTMGEMAAEVAHELGQPLYAILNYAKACRNALAADAGPDRDSLRDWNEKIVQIAADAGAISKRFRAFARQTEPTAWSSCHVNTIVEESLALVAFESRHARVHLETVLAPENPAIYADRVQIQQVLVNLLKNAIEAVDGIEPALRRVTVQTAVVDQNVEITVADNGCGFPPDGMLKAFQAFVTTKPGGLGMGLTVSLTIVEGHGGKLWATPNPTGGACLHCMLPLKERVFGHAR